MAEPLKVQVPDFARLKREGGKIVGVTAYDTPSARLADAAGVDFILVGDSLSMVVLGFPNTLGVTMDVMIHHASAVSRGTSRALLVGDMPWLSYHVSVRDAVTNAGRFVRDGGMQAVKIEGGRKRLGVVRALLDAEIPVMGHLGLTPQSVNRFGGFKVQGKTASDGDRLLDDALALEAAGVFAIVLECIPAELAARVTPKLTVPTIGIGAGPTCDGQILVYHDLIGLETGHRLPRFVRKYADVGEEIVRALSSYTADVRSGAFPTSEESYHAPGSPEAVAAAAALAAAKPDAAADSAARKK